MQNAIPTKKTFPIASKFRVFDVPHVLPMLTESDCGFNNQITGTKCFLVRMPSPCSDRNGLKTINYPAAFNCQVYFTGKGGHDLAGGLPN